MSKNADEIFKKFPGRAVQIKRLWSIIPNKDALPNGRLLSPNFRIVGASGTGKTAVLCRILEEKQISYILVDCDECYTKDLLFCKLLSEIFNESVRYFEIPLNSFYDFWSAFQLAACKAGSVRDDLEYIIFKHSERLDDTTVSNFLYLESEESLRALWKFRSLYLLENEQCHRGEFNFTIHFPRFSKDELCDIILVKRPNYPAETFRNFLVALIGTVYQSERNLNDIIRLADFLFPIYKKPIDEGQLSHTNQHMLYKKIASYIKNSIGCTFSLNDGFNADLVEKPENTEKLYNHLELPYYTKYLLLASYLCSYIPPKMDKQLFCTKSAKRKKQKKTSAYDTKINYLVGPKSFTLNRLLAVYFAIVEERSNISGNLLSQVGSLLELKLIINVGKSQNLSQPQYRCVAKSDLVFFIAKSLKFDIHKFLSFQ